MKRGRMDGHLSKEELEQQQQREEADDGYYSGGTSITGFAKATPQTLASRRFLSAARPANKEQFARHIFALNKQFYDWLKQQLAADECAELDDGAQDYIDHVTSITDRYLRTYGEVLTFGSGDCGQLAHGVDRDEDMMVKFPRVVYSLRDKKVTGVACGGLHNACYTESGQVYTWGCSDDGSLGRDGDENTPLLVAALCSETVIGVACGDGQTMAVTTKGEVWGWGSYKDKEGKKFFNPSRTAQIPHKDIKKQQNEPMKILGLSGVVEVACGSSFNLAKSDDGILYSWGIGESGELGRYVPAMKKLVNDDMDYDLPSILQYHITPGRMFIDNTSATTNRKNSDSNNSSNRDSKLPKLEAVKSFGCGSYHTLVSVIGDTVYACGLNNYGQLGLNNRSSSDSSVSGNDSYSSCTYLTEVVSLSGQGVVCFRGGVHHSLAMTSQGALLAFGRSDSGQLGSSKVSTNTGECSSDPVRPDLPSGVFITAIDCGGNHNLALSSSSEVFTWGYGDMLALGYGGDGDEPLPKKLNFSKAKIRNISITQVAGGGQHSAIVGKVTTA